jgi:hypothetical protein
MAADGEGAATLERVPASSAVWSELCSFYGMASAPTWTEATKVAGVVEEVVMEEALEEIGVKFYKDHSCCNTCGHAEAEDKNYVFYHGQDTDRLRKGDRSVHLAFNLDDEHKAKVLELIEKQTCDAIRLHWSGADHTKMFLTCDDDEMAAHIKDDEERQVRMAKMMKEKETAARRAELMKQLAELDK